MIGLAIFYMIPSAALIGLGLWLVLGRDSGTGRMLGVVAVGVGSVFMLFFPVVFLLQFLSGFSGFGAVEPVLLVMAWGFHFTVVYYIAATPSDHRIPTNAHGTISEASDMCQNGLPHPPLFWIAHRPPAASTAPTARARRISRELRAPPSPTAY